MSLFRPNFEKPGPGVRPDEPRKKGAARVLELLFRDGWSMCKAGLLAFAGLIPFCLGLAFSVWDHTSLVMLLSGVLGGAVAGPQIAGLADTVLRALRDEPDVWWLTYKDAWRQNRKAALLPGALTGLVFAAQIFAGYHLESLATSLSVLILSLVSVVLSLGLFTYIWPQVVLLNLGFGSILRNAVLLFLSNLPRSLGAVGVQLALWALFFFFSPLSFLLLPFVGLWLPMFLGIFLVYIPLEKAFDIERRTEQLHREQRTSDKEGEP